MNDSRQDIPVDNPFGRSARGSDPVGDRDGRYRFGDLRDRIKRAPLDPEFATDIKKAVQLLTAARLG